MWRIYSNPDPHRVIRITEVGHIAKEKQTASQPLPHFLIEYKVIRHQNQWAKDGLTIEMKHIGQYFTQWTIIQANNILITTIKMAKCWVTGMLKTLNINSVVSTLPRFRNIICRTRSCSILNIFTTLQQLVCKIPLWKGLHFSLPARVGSNPARTDVTVWESLSVYLRKVGGLFPNALYNVSGFSLPPIIIDRII
jgi:hypothetical protein